jgi:hypothetical protein
MADPKNLNEMFNKFAKGSKGAGKGVGALIALGGLAYGVSQSIFNGWFIIINLLYSYFL